MSRLFDDASSQYLESASAAVSGVPLTLAAWFNTDTNASQDVLGLGESGGGTQNTFRLNVNGTTAVRAITGASTNVIASTTAGPSLNTWAHGAAVFSAVDSRATYLNGANKGTNTDSRTPTGLNRTAIGRAIVLPSPTSYFSGYIAEAAIWNVALSDADVLSLAQGFSPLLIRPASLVAYWPIIGYSSPELDRRGAFPLTVTGATASGNHPRIIQPTGPRLVYLPAVISEAVGSSSGSSTAGADGASFAESEAVSAGLAVASGVGAALAEAVGSAAGTSTAAAASLTVAAGSGSASGTSTASGVATSTAEAAGVSAGVGAASGVGEATAESAASASGTATAAAVGAALVLAAGSAAGTSAVAGVGAALVFGVGSVAGMSAAAAVGESIAEAAGESDGEAIVIGFIEAQIRAIGESAGSSDALALGSGEGQLAPTGPWHDPYRTVIRVA